jgi:hypothetical protein
MGQHQAAYMGLLYYPADSLGTYVASLARLGTRWSLYHHFLFWFR